MYANLAHPYIYHFLKVICIYADLDHQDALMCSPTPYVIVYFMLTWITQTHPYVRLYADVYLTCIYVDLDHQGSFCDHPDLSYEAYADLDHSDLFIYQILGLNHPLYDDLAYPYINQFFRVICILFYADLENHVVAKTPHVIIISYADLDHPDPFAYKIFVCNIILLTLCLILA